MNLELLSHGFGYGSVCALLSSVSSLKNCGKQVLTQNRFHSSLFGKILSHPSATSHHSAEGFSGWFSSLLLGPVNRALHMCGVK